MLYPRSFTVGVRVVAGERLQGIHGLPPLRSFRHGIVWNINFIQIKGVSKKPFYLSAPIFNIFSQKSRQMLLRNPQYQNRIKGWTTHHGFRVKGKVDGADPAYIEKIFTSELREAQKWTQASKKRIKYFKDLLNRYPKRWRRLDFIWHCTLGEMVNRQILMVMKTRSCAHQTTKGDCWCQSFLWTRIICRQD